MGFESLPWPPVGPGDSIPGAGSHTRRIFIRYYKLFLTLYKHLFQLLGIGKYKAFDVTVRPSNDPRSCT